MIEQHFRSLISSQSNVKSVCKSNGKRWTCASTSTMRKLSIRSPSITDVSSLTNKRGWTNSLFQTVVAVKSAPDSPERDFANRPNQSRKISKRSRICCNTPTTKTYRRHEHFLDQLPTGSLIFTWTNRLQNVYEETARGQQDAKKQAWDCSTSRTNDKSICITT